MWPPTRTLDMSNPTYVSSRHVDMCTLVLGMGLKKQTGLFNDAFEFDDDDDPDHLNLSR